MVAKVIASSDGTSLHFSDTDYLIYNDYIRDRMLMRIKYYKILRAKHGVWASNQNKFVKSISEFNGWDDNYMERLALMSEEQLSNYVRENR